jgi:hypothetical protein
LFGFCTRDCNTQDIHFFCDEAWFHLSDSVNSQNDKSCSAYRVSQNSRIPNSERGGEGPSGARKILRKKNSLFPKKI